MASLGEAEAPTPFFGGEDMADNPLPKPQSNDEPPTDPTKTGYDVMGEDTPVGADESPIEPVKTDYDVEGED